MKKLALSICISAAVLAGCDGKTSPAGAGTGTGETVSIANTEAQARERALTVARENGMAAEVQLVALIVGAVQELRPKFKGSYNTTADSWACGLGMEPEKKAEVRSMIEDELGRVLIPGMELGLFTTGEKEDFNAACIAHLWDEALKPMTAWPRPSNPWTSPAGKKEMQEWAALQVASVEAASRAIAPIANSLAQMPGATTDELREKARELLRKNANAIRDDLKTASIDAIARADQVNINMQPEKPAPIHVIFGNTDYQRSSIGPVLTRHGTSIFGNGHVEGTRYTVEAITSRAASMTSGSSTTTTDQSVSTSTTSAEARTQ